MNIQVVDSRDLIEKRDELKELILNSFIENFPHYEEMTERFEDIRFEEEELENWVQDFESEINEINEINEIEIECTDFQYGESLINEDYFVEYCEELCKDCGYISTDFPSWIEIDWEATANNISQDYTTVNYQGETYYTR